MTDSIVPIDIEELERLLRQRLNSQARQLRVVFRDGHVVLQGRTSSFYAKQLAQAVILESRGETVPVLNEIEVHFVDPTERPAAEEVQ